MTTCLIGYTGFLGKTLLRSNSYDLSINRANLNRLENSDFEQIVGAGLPAEKWKANLEPEVDFKNVEVLKLALSNVRVKKFVLISTVDVYSDPVNCYENVEDNISKLPYGKHRFHFEEFIRHRFEKHLIIRLPALFGHGLKKNILFDLLNRHQIEKINTNSVFQWYPTARLASDIKYLEQIDFYGTINLCTEPLPTQEIIQKCFPQIDINGPSMPIIRYDVLTKFAHLFQQQGSYIQSKSNLLEQIEAFIEEYSL